MFTSQIKSIINLYNCFDKVHDNNLPGFSPGDIKILDWRPAVPALPHWEKVPI